MSIYSYYTYLKYHTLEAEKHLNQDDENLYEDDKSLIFNDLAKITNHPGPKDLTLSERMELLLSGLNEQEKILIMTKGELPLEDIAEKVEEAAYRTMQLLNDKLRGKQPPIDDSVQGLFAALENNVEYRNKVNNIDAWA